MSTKIGANKVPDGAIHTQEDDLLGRWPLAHRIYETIKRHPVEQPLRIGIYGKWGEGKTSVANLVAQIASDAGDIVFSFCPWGSRNSSNLWTKFMIDLYSALEEAEVEVPNELTFSSFKGAKNLQKIKQFARSITGKGGLMDNQLGISLSELDIMSNFMSAFSDDTSTILRSLGNRRVLVIVDDLDRTDPAIIPDLLYAFSEILQVPHLNFILCLDPAMVTAALGKANQEWQNSSFLEKIIDLPFWLNQSSPHTLFELAHKYVVVETGLVSEQLFREELWPVLPRNPRSIKRLARQLTALKPEVDRESITDIANMVKIELFRHEFPELHDLLDVEEVTELSLIMRTRNESLQGRASSAESEPKSLVDEIRDRGVSDPRRIDYAVRLLGKLDYTSQYPGISSGARRTMNAIDHPAPITAPELSALVADTPEISEEIVAGWIEEIQKEKNEIPSRILECMFRIAFDARTRCIWQKRRELAHEGASIDPSKMIPKYLTLLSVLAIDIDSKEEGEPIIQSKDLHDLIWGLCHHSDDQTNEERLITELFTHSKLGIAELYGVADNSFGREHEPLKNAVLAILDRRTLAQIFDRMADSGRLSDLLSTERGFMRYQLLQRPEGLLATGQLAATLSQVCLKDPMAVSDLVLFVLGHESESIYRGFPSGEARKLWEIAKPILEGNARTEWTVATFEDRLAEIEGISPISPA